jgi:hypothetical protein
VGPDETWIQSQGCPEAPLGPIKVAGDMDSNREDPFALSS